MAQGKCIFTVKIDVEKCKGCNLCIDACPEGLIVMKGSLNKKGVTPCSFEDAEECCKGCMACARICPECGIAIYKVSEAKTPITKTK